MKKKILQIFFTIIIIILLMLVPTILKQEIFYIVDIKYKQENKYIQKDITDKFEALKNKSIFLINLTKIQNEIQKDIRVESVEIKRKLPSTIIVDIKEKDFIAIQIDKDKKYMLDKNLNTIIYLKDKKDNKTYPIIYFKNEEKEQILSIIQKIFKSNLANYVSEIAKLDNIWTVILKNGIKVYTNPDVEIIKYNFAKELNDKIIIQKYIDLRFKDINTR